MAHDVVLIPGDGIGPEITQAMRRVVEAHRCPDQLERPGGRCRRHGPSLARRCPNMCSMRSPRPRLPSRAPSPRRSARASAALTWPCASTLTCMPACVPVCRSQATARASATLTWSSCARTPRTSTPVSNSMRALPRSRSSHSSSSVRAKRPSPPIPRSRSSRSPSPRAAALWSMPLSTPAAAAAKR